MYGVSIFSTPKWNRKITYWVSLGHLSGFLIDAVNSFFEKRNHITFQIRGDKIQGQQNLKTK